jgi:hypothetical protein
LCDTFPVNNTLKQGDALWSLLLKFALEFVIWDDQINQEGLKLNSEHQLLVYADDVNILGENTHTVKKNKGALVVEFDIRKSAHLQYIPRMLPTRCYTLLNLFISIKRSTCFRRFLRPSSGAQTVRTASGICQIVAVMVGMELQCHPNHDSTRQQQDSTIPEDVCTI